MRPTEPLVALLAGFVSFLAPCVLPLVPGYLSAVSAVEADRLGAAARPGVSCSPASRSCSASRPSSSRSASAPSFSGRGSSTTSSCSSGWQGSSSSSSGSRSWACCRGRSVLWERGCCRERGAAGRACFSAGRLRSARHRVSGPCWRRSSSSPAPPTPSSRARFCSRATRSGWRFRSCSRERSSRGRWERSVGCATTFSSIQFVSGAIMVALGLMLFFERFYLLRIYLNRALEHLGLDGVFLTGKAVLLPC